MDHERQNELQRMQLSGIEVAEAPVPKMTHEGQPCRKCLTPIVKRRPKQRKTFKAKQTYYFEYYLYCPECRTMYMVETAKRDVRSSVSMESGIPGIPSGFVPKAEGVPFIACDQCGAAIKDIDGNWKKHSDWHSTLAVFVSSTDD